MEEETNFEIIESEAVKRQLFAIWHRAEQLGFGDAIIDAADNITSSLRSSPRHFGEPRYHLDHAKLEVRVGIRGLLAVRFAIHDDRPVVLIGGYILMGP